MIKVKNREIKIRAISSRILDEKVNNYCSRSSQLLSESEFQKNKKMISNALITFYCKKIRAKQAEVILTPWFFFCKLHKRSEHVWENLIHKCESTWFRPIATQKRGAHRMYTMRKIECGMNEGGRLFYLHRISSPIGWLHKHIYATFH